MAKVMASAVAYWDEPDDLVPDQLGVLGLLDDAYFSLRMLQLVSARLREESGQMLVADDLSALDDVVRDMIGAELIEVLDDLVILSLSNAPVDELIATIAEHSGGFMLASAQTSFTGLSVVELVEERLGFTGKPITTLLGNARAFRRTVDELVQPWAGSKIDKIAGIEARGFILGGAVAHQVSAGFVPIRKKGKLPHKRVSMTYALEYGEDVIEMHADALVSGERVVLVDDLIATGGTAEAAVKLLRQLGAEVLAACFVIDLPELGGAKKLRALGVPVRTLIAFEGH